MPVKYDDPAVLKEASLTADCVIANQREAALFKTGVLHNAIFNSANFSSIATDEKGIIRLFNIGAERMLGYSAIEVVDKITPADISDPQEVIARAKALSLELSTPISPDFEALVSKASRDIDALSRELAAPITPGFDALVFKAARGIEDIYELTYIRKDGSPFPAVVSVTALRDDPGGIVGYLLIGIDNTARKQVEAEQKLLDQRLRDHQFYTRSLIESNIDALMTTDPSGIITDVNRRMEALTGCARDELIGAPFQNFFTDPERAEAGIRQALTEGKVTDYELTARARDGKETVVSCNATTFHGPDRKLRGVFAAARDVTEQKRFESALREKNVELEWAKAAAEARITERTADLVRTNKELEAFAYSVSHDLRAPLRHLDGYAELLRKNCYAKMDAPGQRYLDKISNSARRMGQLIDDLLAFSRLLRTEVSRTSVSLQRLQEEVRHELELDLAGRNVVWIIGDLPVVYGDRSMLRQVFVNLLSNAVKYTCHQPEARIEIGCAGTSGEETTIFVRDNGAGFEMQYIAKLFEVFQRLHSDEYEGTGIGLATVRRIVERHGGRVWAEGAVGKGATFYCSLRLAMGTAGI
jgi:PAS domain S-box-containing protein